MFHFNSARIAPRSRSIYVRGVLAAFAFIIFVSAAQGISAATITVNSLSDAQGDEGLCTLREAIISANTDTASGATAGECAAGQPSPIVDTISIPGGSIDLLTPLPQLSSDMAIAGLGSANSTVRRSPAAVDGFRIFDKFSGSATFSLMTIRDGTSPAIAFTGSTYAGAGVYNNGGQLTFANVVITNNMASGDIGFGNGGLGLGAAIYTLGPLTITGSTISNNAASGGGGFAGSGGSARGGAIYASAVAVSITNTVISGNTATGTNSGTPGLPGGSGEAGGLYLNGPSTIINSTIENNTATAGNNNDASGGGLVTGPITITNTTIRGNTATGGNGGHGGGILAFGPMNISGSTISGNTATGGATGGGIDAGSVGPTRITNSTISGNTATGINFPNGGGILSGLALTLTNVTITNNSAAGAGSASGLYQNNSTVTLKNTIVAGDTDNSTVPDVGKPVNGGAFVSAGYNLIGNPGAVTVFTQTGDQTGSAGAPLNPRLAPLGNYGGSKQTHFLFGDSPALDKGAAATDPITGSAITTDQRGRPRPVDLPGTANATNGDGSDIGAFESQVAPNTASGVSVAGRVMTVDGRGLTNATVALTDRQGVTRSVVTGRFGSFQFDDVEVGPAYVVSVASRRFRFVDQVINVSDSLTGINFIPSAAAPTRGMVRAQRRRQ